MTTSNTFDITTHMSMRIKKLPSALLLVCVVGFLSFVYAAEPTRSAYSCHGKSLSQKDCLLRLGTNKIHFWQDKIMFGDGINLVTANIPGQNADVVWQSIFARHLSSRWLIEMAFWSGAEPTTGIETLNWYVFEIDNGRVLLKLQKPVQKRVRNAKGKWRFDKMITHQVYLKGGKVYGRFGREDKPLK